MPLRADVDDAAIVEDMARGRSAALGILYDRYGGRMLAVARRICGNPVVAEDITHDVFLEVWRNSAAYDPQRGSVRAWLVLRTRSRAIDFRKSASFSRTVPVEDDAWLDSQRPQPPDTWAIPDRLALKTAFGALSPDQREVLILGYFEGLSSSEIATRVGIPLGTVKSRVAAALSTLRTWFAVRVESTT